MQGLIVEEVLKFTKMLSLIYWSLDLLGEK